MGPLDGLRVLDIGTLFPAGLTAAMLGDLGADVIKVEPPGGDSLRSMGAKVDGQSLVWAVVGRNKRSITLDLNQARGQQLLQRLVERADLLVENLPQRSLERWHTWCSTVIHHAKDPCSWNRGGVRLSDRGVRGRRRTRRRRLARGEGAGHPGRREGALREDRW